MMPDENQNHVFDYEHYDLYLALEHPEPYPSPEYLQQHAQWMVGMLQILLYLSRLQSYLGFHRLISHQLNTTQLQMIEHLLRVEQERAALHHEADADCHSNQEAVHYLHQHLHNTAQLLWQLKRAGYY